MCKPHLYSMYKSAGGSGELPVLAKKIFDEGKVSFAREIFENKLAREFFSMKGGEETA